ncbi:MAG: KEOPS complex subunit Pcc1 [Candidatus Nanohaloarchaea archaeon]
MRSRLEIENPGIAQTLELSLESRNRVKYSVTGGDPMTVEVEAESLGALRGATDTVFRLASLAKRIHER